MINLLSHEIQKQHRAARLNLKLRAYVVVLVGTLLVVTGVFGGGYFLTMQERATAESTLAEHRQQTASYQHVRDEAKGFADNLKIAKSILSQEILYSDLVTRIAQALPPNAVLTALNVSEALPTDEQLQLNARVKTQADAVVLKNTLEASPLFENVSINNVTEDPPSNAADENNNRIMRDFPVTVTLSVDMTKQGASS